jgi:hypothetical protein
LVGRATVANLATVRRHPPWPGQLLHVGEAGTRSLASDSRDAMQCPELMTVALDKTSKALDILGRAPDIRTHFGCLPGRRLVAESATTEKSSIVDQSGYRAVVAKIATTSKAICKKCILLLRLIGGVQPAGWSGNSLEIPDSCQIMDIDR